MTSELHQWSVDYKQWIQNIEKLIYEIENGRQKLSDEAFRSLKLTAQFLGVRICRLHT